VAKKTLYIKTTSMKQECRSSVDTWNYTVVDFIDVARKNVEGLDSGVRHGLIW